MKRTNNTTEQWVSIENLSNYEVNNFGVVRDIHSGHTVKTLVFGGCKKHGYYKGVNLLNDTGELVKYYVHRLVAEAFLSNVESKSDVRHLNGDKSDNNADNLKWVTRAENMKLSIANGQVSKRRTKIDLPTVLAIRFDSYVNGLAASTIAKKYNRCTTSVKHIIRRISHNTDLYLKAEKELFSILNNK